MVNYRKYAGIALSIILMLLPLMHAQADSQAEYKITNTNLVVRSSTQDLRELFFEVRTFFALDGHSKIDLLRAKHDRLVSRQQYWLKSKEEVFANSTIYTSDEIISFEEKFEVEHHDLLHEYITISSKTEDIRIAADIEMDQSLSNYAAALSNELANSPLTSGLTIKSMNNGNFPPTNQSFYLSLEEAKMLVSTTFNFEIDSSYEENKNSTVYYIVAAHDLTIEKGITIQKNYLVRIDPQRGSILRVDIIGQTSINENPIIEIDQKSHDARKSDQNNSDTTSIEEILR